MLTNLIFQTAEKVLQVSTKSQKADLKKKLKKRFFCIFGVKFYFLLICDNVFFVKCLSSDPHQLVEEMVGALDELDSDSHYQVESATLSDRICNIIR